jgi:hypothetical protein
MTQCDRFNRSSISARHAGHAAEPHLQRSWARRFVSAREAVVPASESVGYSGKPLPAKLGIKPNTVVALIDAPEGFENTLGKLPAGAKTVRGRASHRDRPKKAGQLATNVDQNDVRSASLARGLVDFKVCAIDARWSGLRFARRKS